MQAKLLVGSPDKGCSFQISGATLHIYIYIAYIYIYIYMCVFVLVTHICGVIATEDQ